jgi:membrane protease YdiL (CAAX protease family)
LLVASAYDVGINVLSAELFFRGVIFNSWHRERGFWVGASVSTGACALRYLADPALPWTPEVIAGALFYLMLLGFAASALFARFGSLFPALVGTSIFFGAYRTLHLW